MTFDKQQTLCYPLRGTKGHCQQSTQQQCSSNSMRLAHQASHFFYL